MKINDIELKKENLGSSVYMVAEIPENIKLIGYQTAMITNNDIKYLANASKKQNNNRVEMYYNISDSNSLMDKFEKTRLSKKEFTNLIEGIIGAYKEIKEYQLFGEGLLINAEYIYLDSAKNEIRLIYLPVYTSGSGLNNFKEFLMEIIMQGKVEMSDNDLIPKLLECLNRADLTIEAIETTVKSSKNSMKNMPKSRSVPQREPIRDNNYDKMQEFGIEQTPSASVNREIKEKVSTLYGDMTVGSRKRRENDAEELKKIRNKQQKNSEASQRKHKEVNEKNNGKGIIFGVAQLIIVGVLAFAYTKGLFSQIEYAAAAVLIAAGADFIIYRELFVNHKEESEIQKEKSQQEVKKPPMAMSGRPMPAGKPEKPENNRSASKNEETSSAHQKSSENAKYESRPVYSEETFGSEDTVVIPENNYSDAYLEFYQNGEITNIPLNYGRTTIGKLQNHVDFAINNNKISKIHAQIIFKDGGYYVIDLNSTNGTYINGSGQRLSSNIEYPIYSGDRITLANVDLIFKRE